MPINSQDIQRLTEIDLEKENQATTVIYLFIFLIIFF